MIMPDRRTVIVAALAATLAAAAWVTVLDQPPVQPKRSATDGSKLEPAGRRSSAQRPVGDLRLPTRTAESGEIVELFALRQAANAAASGSGRKQEKPVAPPLPFVFLGRYAEGDVVRVFLGDGEQIYMVKVGDVIEQKYRVDKIDSVVKMTYLPLNETQILAIGEM